MMDYGYRKKMRRISYDRRMAAVGSAASRSASPTKLMATTKITIKSPGGIHSQGCFVSTVKDCALFNIFPRLAAGGCTVLKCSPLMRREKRRYWKHRNSHTIRFMFRRRKRQFWQKIWKISRLPIKNGRKVARRWLCWEMIH